MWGKQATLCSVWSKCQSGKHTTGVVEKTTGSYMGGTFNIQFAGMSSDPLPHNASAEDVRRSIAALMHGISDKDDNVRNNDLDGSTNSTVDDYFFKYVAVNRTTLSLDDAGVSLAQDKMILIYLA